MSDTDEIRRLIEAAFLERAGHLGGELAGLLAGGVEVEGAVDDHSQRPDRHDKKHTDNSLSRDAHVVPEVHGAKTDGRSRVLEQIDTESSLMGSKLGEVSENH